MNGKLAKRIRGAAARVRGHHEAYPHCVEEKSVKQLKREYRAMPYHLRKPLGSRFKVPGHSAALKRWHRLNDVHVEQKEPTPLVYDEVSTVTEDMWEKYGRRAAHRSSALMRRYGAR